MGEKYARTTGVAKDVADNLSATSRIGLRTTSEMVPVLSEGTIFFTEDFDDTNFDARGWFDPNIFPYDSGIIDTSVKHSGAASYRAIFAKSAKRPTNGVLRRRLFPASESVYLKFWMKLGDAVTTWVGSQKAYHPHLFLFLTDADGAFSGLSDTFLTVYFEALAFQPLVGIQDGARLDQDNLGSAMLGTAPPHAVAGGNGNQPGADAITWYDAGGGNYTNFTQWVGGENDLSNDTWHLIECYVQMNSIQGGLPQADGILNMAVDGVLRVDRQNVELRTAQYPTQKFNQLIIAPYIGDGSPIAQSLWIDELTLASGVQAVTAPTYLPSRLSALGMAAGMLSSKERLSRREFFRRNSGIIAPRLLGDK